MVQVKDTRTKLITEKPFRLMLSLSLPAIIGMVVIGLYNFIDAVFVGQMISPQAMGAVTVSYPFTLVNSAIATLIGVGSASVLSRAIGKKEQSTIDKIMGNLIMSVLLLSVAVTVLGMIFTRQILILSGAKGEILENAVIYLRIIFAGSIFVNFSQAANMVMRGEGLLKRAMLIMGAGAVLNIILAPIMISITHSVSGAAYATVTAQVTQAVITLWYFLKKSKNVGIHAIRIDKALIPEVLSVGISAMLMQLMQLIQQTIMYNTAASYGGNEWQIILGACLRIQAFAFIPLWGISQGFQPAIGTNYGAKEYLRVKKITRTFIIGATVFSLLFYIPVMAFPQAMLSMFITEAGTAQMGVGSLRLFFSTYILLGVMILSITLFQSLGKGGIAAILTLLRQMVFFIPLALILPGVGSLGIHGVFLAPVLTDIGVLVLSSILIAKVFIKMNTFKSSNYTNISENQVICPAQKNS
ncbi:putative MATE family efflux protein [Ruminiclostridium sufflavum DSM 19573]|uniref:Multidrug export protein MepA n=1 Tax=Ruminiclostridium sufflavum DSM 19573 TaxID=1121337 RepID=A0A318XMI2_9FIRM|nr:MATE family efflux transporter [Ruminiclostridium sufflavum]PYG87966.1 putative MATE family efflux protein [Ruminiclostridium sufflavum DSM 19573]